MIWRIALLVFGVVACSTSVLFIKASHTPPVLLAGFRLLLAAAVLSPLLWRDLRRHPGSFDRKSLVAATIAGAILGVHFITWIIGARATASANASLIVNMVPVAMPLLLLVLIRERLTRVEMIGTAVAIAGLVLLGGSDFQLSRDHFIGDMICFVSMVLFCWYLVLGRRNRGYASLWMYVVPLYFAGGLLCVAAGGVVELIRPTEGVSYNLHELSMIVGLAVVPTIIGHSTLNYAMKHLRGQVVGIINGFQFVSAGIMAYFIRNETPAAMFYPAGLLVLIGTFIVLRFGGEHK